MPITSIASYVTTATEMGNSWQKANAALGTPLLLARNYGLANLLADRDAASLKIDGVSVLAATAREKGALRDQKRGALKNRVTQFRFAVGSQLPDSVYVGECPQAPPHDAAKETFMKPVTQVKDIWTKINAGENLEADALTTPLTLAGNYSLAQFVADEAAMSKAFDDSLKADMDATFARRERDVFLKGLYAHLKGYRDAVQAQFSPSSPVMQTLPRLTPEEGTTPTALVIEGVYDSATNEAVFSFAVATGKNLQKLQVRACTGTTYKADEEENIGDLPVTATEFRTKWGLSVPGAKIVVKIYVMTTTGNENGGKAVKIVRPEAA